MEQGRKEWEVRQALVSAPDSEMKQQNSTPTSNAPPAQQANDSYKRMVCCAITGRECSKKDLIRLDHLRPSLAERILQDHPDLSEDSLVSQREANRYRGMYVEEILRQEHGEFTELDQQVAASVANHELIAANIEEMFDSTRTFGERVSDEMASFGGSWSFIFSFAFFLLIWMGYNAYLGEMNAWDPYPFILLNLALSALAAIQAPVIMMSQKRQEAKDRNRSLNDYRINLKAELEIRHLQEKLDHLISRQWARLAEIQQIQMDLILQNQNNPKKKFFKKGRPASRKTALKIEKDSKKNTENLDKVEKIESSPDESA